MKLQQENELIELSSKFQFRVRIARISNAYGTEQKLDKKQGLISLLVKAALDSQEITIYVPMETKRDYIYAEDIGKKVSRFVLENEENDSKVKVKIIASGFSYTISDIVSEIDRLTGNSTPIVFANQRETSLQPKSLVFESVIMTSIDNYKCVSLTEGIEKLIISQQIRK
jgi:UDP-glucose 4-epimerase